VVKVYSREPHIRIECHGLGYFGILWAMSCPRIFGILLAISWLRIFLDTWDIFGNVMS